MAVATTPRVRPPLWRDLRVLRIAGQALFVVVLVVVAQQLYLNLDYSVRQRGVDLNWDFLRFRSSIPIKEGIDYHAGQSNTKALLVAYVNTLRAALVGIGLASLLGLVIGVARLSPNWLIRKISQVYVEIFRNTPALIQIIFWYLAVVLALPAVGEAEILGLHLSNRGAALPWPRIQEGAPAWSLFLLVGLVAALIVRRWRTRTWEATGRPHRRFLWESGTFLAIAAVGYVIVGTPVRIDVPVQGRFGYTGGAQMSGEYFALLAGLTIYTSAFIGEIIRGSILAVSKGQKEAGEALGLTPLQQLRFVVLPQALRIAIPPINSQYLNLTKNTSLAIAVGYPELVSVGRSIINKVGRPTQMILVIMAVYLTTSLVISLIMNIVNRSVAMKGASR